MSGWNRVSGMLLVTGALAWLAKLAVIVATGGEVADTGAAGLFFLAGLVLLAVGAAGAGAGLAWQRGVLARVGGAVVALVAFFFSFAILGDIVKAAIGDRGPVYAADETGILIAALVWLAVGLWTVRRAEAGAEPASA